MPTVPGNGNGNGGQRPTPEYMMMAAATMFKNGNLTVEQQKARQEAGQEYTETIQAMGDIGNLGQKFSAEGKTRSQDVEDVRDTGQIGQADRAADVSLQKMKGVPVAYEMRKMQAGQTKKAPTQMAKDLGYEDIDAAADRITKARAQNVMATRRH